jgi:hypothetical protein
MGLKRLRAWLFLLCQSRSGQCLRKHSVGWVEPAKPIAPD